MNRHDRDREEEVRMNFSPSLGRATSGFVWDMKLRLTDDVLKAREIGS